MSEPNCVYKTRLAELMRIKGVSDDEFCEKYNFAKDTLKAFKSCKRNIHLDVALKIVTDYNVTLDWFYCRTERMDDRDLIVDIICALDKVLKLEVKKAIREEADGTYDDSSVVLRIDSSFCDFLQKVQALRSKYIADGLTNEDYKNKRKEIQSQYRWLFREVFEEEYFNDEKNVEISDFYGLNILDMLGATAEIATEIKQNTHLKAVQES